MYGYSFHLLGMFYSGNYTVQPREKQVRIEQLQYELNSESRRSEAEVTSLRERVRDLELRMVETRKEADEYMKSSIEANNRVTSLTQQVSATNVLFATISVSGLLSIQCYLHNTIIL